MKPNYLSFHVFVDSWPVIFRFVVAWETPEHFVDALEKNRISVMVDIEAHQVQVKEV